MNSTTIAPNNRMNQAYTRRPILCLVVPEPTRLCAYVTHLPIVLVGAHILLERDRDFIGAPFLRTLLLLHQPTLCECAVTFWGSTNGTVRSMAMSMRILSNLSQASLPLCVEQEQTHTSEGKKLNRPIQSWTYMMLKGLNCMVKTDALCA